MKILFIDDEDLLRECMYELLSDMGHEVTVEDNGKKAAETFLKNPEEFDLVLTDLMMVNMTGDKLAEIIHSIYPNMPVVVMTGTPDNIPPKKAKSAGICQVLPKPLTKTELREALGKIEQCAATRCSQEYTNHSPIRGRIK